MSRSILPAREILAGLFFVQLLPVVPAVAEGPHCQVPGLEPQWTERARAILDRVPLIDGHNDLPWRIREQFSGKVGKIDLRANLSTLDDPPHTDFPRLEAGGLGAQFWSVYVPVDLEGAAAVQAVVEQIDVVHRLEVAYPDRLAPARTADDIERIHDAGKIASLIGIEGGHSIGGSLAVLRQLYDLGARYMTLTHWRWNAWADAATSEPKHGGLTPFGRAVIGEMNRLGMLVDLSHVAETTMHQALDISRAPVIYSHSSARALADHPRNVSDAVLERLVDNGGVVMVTFVPSFVDEGLRRHLAAREAEEARLASLFIGQPEAAAKALEAWDGDHPRPRASLATVADHIDHIRSVAGIDHVGIGSDYDGISSVPDGLEDVSCYPALLGELLRRGWTDEEIGQLAGNNVLRVLRAAEAVAAELAASPIDETGIDDDASEAENPAL